MHAPRVRRAPAPSHVAGESADVPVDEELDAEARRALGAEAGRGDPLPAPVRAEQERRFGTDLGEVRTHTSAAAAELAHGLRARAFTSGADIFFAPGQFQPDAPGGRSLLAHEIAHVVDQANAGRAAVQRLLRSPFPWSGVVTAPAGANLRRTPDAADPATILLAMPAGSHVTVVASSGLWLRVEYASAGTTVTGYVLHTLVDDATSAALASMVGTRMTWRGSGPGSGTTFESWASAATEAPFPAITGATVINCWETVLLAAFRAGVLSWARIHAIYTSGAVSGWPALMSAGPRRVFVRAGVSPAPQRGDLVFFDGMSHVALATGNGTEVYSFWPAPDTPFVPGGTPDRVKVVSIEAITTWWTAHFGAAPKVEIGAPSW